MTYNAYELSSDSGSIVELYEFIRGLDRSYFCSTEQSILHEARNYVPAPIVRSRIKQTSNMFNEGLTFTFPKSYAVASQFLNFAPDAIVNVRVLRGHLNDPDKQFITYWLGRVVGANATGNEIEIDCESVFTSIKRPGLRAKFEINCRHALYGSGCSVNREAYRYDVGIAAVSGLNVTVQYSTHIANGFFTGGMLVDQDDNSRFITSQIADVITISKPLQTLSGASVIRLYPGCDHTLNTCNVKFSNIDNFGGFPYIPTVNPFNGQSVW